MFGMSGEHLLVLLVILLIFGPRRLPELGHSIGRTLKNFKDGMSNVTNTEATAPAPRAKAPEASKAEPSVAASAPVTPVEATTATPVSGPASHV
jgi:sec-independent protein translocase protein TatA